VPTVSEPTWPERDDRIKIAVQQFVKAKSREVDDSEDVLKARLFGLGLRGQDLELEFSRAKTKKFERLKCPGTGQVCRRKKLIGPCKCAWEDRIDAA
jgi:hypothetical protein